MDVYHEYLADLQNDPIALLELGVAEGTSLLHWRDFLTRARVVGLDIRPIEINDPTGRIAFYVGEQQDRALLDRIAAETAPGGFDVIIDDASHNGQLTRISFWHLLEHHLKPGGLYFIEDWGCSYWNTSQDGRRYVPRPVDLTWSEKLLDAVRNVPFVKQNDFLRRSAGYMRRKVGKRVIPSHQYGMVGLVKEIVDECGAPDMTDDHMGGAGPKRPSMISWMRISCGLVVVKKAGKP
jgi:hypothetical protein